MDVAILLYGACLALGVIFLWWTGDLAVHYALEAASLYKLTSLFSGFVILAVSTGIPEIAVAFSSLWSNVPQISAANIIGSNVVDITLVLGIAALIAGKLPVTQEDYPNVIMMHLIALLAMISVFLLGSIGSYYGFFLITLYMVTLWWIWYVRLAPQGKAEEIGGHKKRPDTTTVETIEEVLPEHFFTTKRGVLILFALSMAGVLISAKLVVWAAVVLAKNSQLTFESIGTTIVALGTSLPELSVSLNAIKRNEHSLAIGNSLGSVLVQGTFILGLQAMLSPQKLDLAPLRSAAPFMFAAFATIGYGLIKRKKINRIEGIILLLIFCLFVGYEIFLER